MSDVESFFGKLKELARSLEDAHEKAQEASEEADRFGGEWQQELSTDLDDVTVRIRDLISDLDGRTRSAAPPAPTTVPVPTAAPVPVAPTAGGQTSAPPPAPAVAPVVPVPQTAGDLAPLAPIR